MRAAVLMGLEQDAVVRDVELGEPGPEEVKVRMAAAGVCRSDLSMIHGVIPFPVPTVLGHEGAGEVLAVGEGVTTVGPGDHVIVSWSPPCGHCESCYSGRAYLCMDIQAMASMTPHAVMDGMPIPSFAGAGTFAEETIIPWQGAIKVPNDVPLEIASLLGCGVITGVGAALNTAKVRPGSTVCVIGAGGVGISVIQGSRIAGASAIVAVDPFESKLEMAKRFGATHGATPDGVGAVSMELTGSAGFDYVFEVVGSPQTIRKAWDLTRRGGETIIVGMGRMDAMVEFAAYDLFFSSKTLKGCYYGGADVRVDFDRLLRLWRTGRLDLEGMISQTIDLAEVNDALAALNTGEVIRSVIKF
ncbi:MAG TPA: Zn-dependent alcohol dehydrogenase [Actinomycetota bacterium]|nr:Zn-dependent alcohol dehydrogenase [Actinomycetota bacterium]